jgi:outer membrane immunogenic protein
VASASALSGTGNFPIDNGGFIGGGQIGYNYQFYNNFVVGLEADIQGIAGSSSTATAGAGAGVPGFPANALSGTVSTSKSLDYLGTVRGRIGYLVTPTLLVYGTGGLAYGGANSSTSVFQGLSGPVGPGLQTAFGTSGSYSDTLVGWTAGAGLEWLFAPNWSAKLEYLYYDLGTVSYGSGLIASTAASGANFFTNVVSTTTKFDGHIVRAGVNYHFNWGSAAPVLAKY